ncbi:long-chain-fatty-acid--CoA ligase 5 isoform X3 [Parasteatoda tepidariorum]|uniref:long-chain-fatty-acid--CoA ligase 5 isoform X3 n=1 Tax=Parasteatoda tepidariorum TaxID=114398 RepID=UPI0039BD6CC4
MDLLFRVVQRKNYIGSGLINLGLEPSQRTMIGICTKTRPEFVLTMLACSNYSMVLVPLYNCFGTEAISHIISQVEMEAVICETPEHAAGIIKNQEKYPKLKHIILIDDDEDELKNSGSRFNIMSLKELEASGKLDERKEVKPRADDIFCLCYTSGTTGEPKGVVVSHRNVLSCIGSLSTVLSDSVSNDTLICYLPCAHIYEIINEIFCLYKGGRLGFYSGTTEDLLDDMQKLKPNVVPLVPKLMNLIYSAVRKQMVPFPFKRRLFELALLQKQKELCRGIARKNTVWDKLIFSKIQERLGGRAKLIFSSSAPVCKEVMQFFRCSMGCLVFEVYGLSEVGASVMTLMSEDKTGFVGAPLPCNHIKLVSIPELSYHAEDNVGEICIRGPNVFKGYYKNANATKEVFDEDGWYHTGDIGKWNENGTLSVIDRKKHIFKLSQGEYIVPEKSEGVYMQSPIVSQIYVDGDPNQDFIVGIVVPDRNLFIRWAKKKGFQEMEFETLCQNDDVKRAVLSHLLKLGRKKDLNSLHQVGNVYLSPEPFSLENGLLTPTLKVKRSVARKMFESNFEKLYEEGNLRKLQGL